MSRVVHFEIQADDLERAKAFYAAVFAWEYEDYSEFTGSPYWGIVTGAEETPGINGGLLARAGVSPAAKSGANAFVCTVVVEDYDAVETKILEAGGSVVSPKSAMVGMAWQGYYLDSEGNTFGLHQEDVNAA